MSEERYRKLTLLHSNDMHGDFLAENVDDNLVGGVSMLSGYVNKVRREEPNTLYCIAGDMFRGSVIDSEFLGLSTIQIMNMLDPDVVTLGNHETDYGLAHLLFIEKCANFPIINANLHIRQNNVRLFKPYQILKVDGMSILFIGILTEDVIAQTKGERVIGSFVDITDAAREVGRICDAHNAIDIDFTVLLTHIGFEEDQKLAALLDPAWGVDLIIGGHSHTFIDEPAVVNGIPIVQAGTGTDQIGRFDIIVDTDNNCIDSYTWKTVPIDAEHCDRDPKIEELISSIKAKTDLKYGRVITRFKRELTHPDRYMQTDLGSAFADAFKESFHCDIALCGSGSVRTFKCGPIMTFGDFTETFPYDDEAWLLNLSGAQFKKVCKHICRDEAWQGDHTEFFQFSEGIQLTYSKSRHDFDVFKLNGEDIDPEKIYTVVIPTYHYNNIKDSLGITPEEAAENGKPRVIASSIINALEEYFQEHNHLDASAGDRLVVVD